MDYNLNINIPRSSLISLKDNICFKLLTLLKLLTNSSEYVTIENKKSCLLQNLIINSNKLHPYRRISPEKKNPRCNNLSAR